MAIQVVHVDRGFRISKNYAEQVMRDHCSITWVTVGESIRDTTDEERMALRAEQAQRVKAAMPLPYAEIEGLSFQPPTSGLASTKASLSLVREAHLFCSQAA
jgi:hypothetical protein